MASYRNVLKKARQLCEQAGIGSQAPQILLLEKTNMDNTSLYLHYEDEMPQPAYDAYQADLAKLLAGQPLAYVLGFQWFYGYKMAVSKDVLIPRYETEELVANVLADIDLYFAGRKHLTVADVATGSGNIALALVKEEPKIKMFATDISAKALNVAKANAASLQCHVTFYKGSMLKPLIDHNVRLDVLVCNPPYIPRKQDIDNSVRDYEPHVALFGGDDGLRFYRLVMSSALKVIKSKSFLAFEIGYDEAASLLAMAQKYFPDDRSVIIKDINGKDRMLFIYHNL